MCTNLEREAAQCPDLEKVCYFDLSGKIVQESTYMSVYRKGNILVVEFINNLILPFVVKGNSLFLLGNEVLKTNHGGLIRVAVEKIAFDDSIAFSMSREVALAVWGSDVSGTAGYEFGVSLGDNYYSDIELEEWCSEHAICMPNGCLWDSFNSHFDAVCKFADKDKFLLISFPNNLKLPVFRTKRGFRVACLDVYPDIDEFWAMFIKINEMSDRCVKFRFSLYTDGRLQVFDDFELRESGVRCGNVSISSHTIAKYITLGVE